jgi:hypothetical protein
MCDFSTWILVRKEKEGNKQKKRAETTKTKLDEKYLLHKHHKHKHKHLSRGGGGKSPGCGMMGAICPGMAWYRLSAPAVWASRFGTIVSTLNPTLLVLLPVVLGRNG